MILFPQIPFSGGYLGGCFCPIVLGWGLSFLARWPKMEEMSYFLYLFFSLFLFNHLKIPMDYKHYMNTGSKKYYYLNIFHSSFVQQ
jgi:hypothetical protein